MNKRVLFTLGFCAVYVLLSKMVLPGVDKNVLRQMIEVLPGPVDYGEFTVMAIGPNGYFLSFIFVAMMSIVYAGWRNYRKTGVIGWRRLEVRAFRIMLLLAIPNSFLLGVFILNFSREAPGLVTFENPGTFFAAVIAASLAGVLFCYFGIVKSRQWGLGHGLSLLFFCEFIASGYFLDSNLGRPETFGADSQMVLIVGTLAIVLGLGWAMRQRFVCELGKTQTGSHPMLVLNVFPAGVIALLLTHNLFNYLNVVIDLDISPNYSFLITLPLMVISSLLLGWLFNRYHYPSRLHLERVNLLALPTFWKAQLLGLVVVGFLGFGMDLIPPLARVLGRFDFVIILILLAIGMDLFEEIQLRVKCSKIADVCVFHQVLHADHAGELLKREKIPFAIRARYHRGLLHFVGLMFEMTLMVPEENREAAFALLKEAMPWIAEDYALLNPVSAVNP